MGKEITVEVKNVYGKSTIYPIDTPFAWIHERLTGRKTLTNNDILCYAQLGFTIMTDYQNNSFSFDANTNKWIVTSL